MAEMTIAQALRRAAKLRGDIKQNLTYAAQANVYEENKPPAFNTEKVLAATDELVEQLVAVEAGLRRANSRATVEWQGKSITLSEATARLREYKGRIAWLRGLPTREQPSTVEMSLEYDDDMKRRSVAHTYKCVLPTATVSKMIHEAQESFDALNDAVETANHRTVL